MKILLWALLFGTCYAAEQYEIKTGVTLVYFEMDNCAPCRALRTRLTEMGLNNVVTFYNMNTAGVRDYAQGLAVDGAPTVIVYELREGKNVEIGRFVGLKSEAEIVVLLALKRKTK